VSHYEAKMTSKGQLTVPSDVREFLHLETGDIVDFYLDEAREVRIRARNRDMSELFGSLNACLDRTGRSVTIEQTGEAVGVALAEDDARIQREWREHQEFLAWKRAKAAQAAQ